MAVSMGVEEEFHIVDVESRMLVPRAPEVLDRLPRRGFAHEFQRSVVESNSGVHRSLDALHADLARSRRTLAAAAAPLGLAPVAAGTPPLARLGTVAATAHPRYLHMADEYRRVADEQLICGAQVHVDVPDRDTAVRAICVLAPWLPTLLALSASSPCWLGADTGYASWRTLLWQRWPSTGPAGCFASAAEYDAAVAELVRSGVVSDPGMVYYDVRPSAHQQTLELRICDACPRLETVLLIAGLFRALVVDACETVQHRPAEQTPGEHRCPPARQQWLRAATWRAARSGLDGDLLDPATGQPAPADAVVRALLARSRPTLEAYGDWSTVVELTEHTLRGGTAARRLRQVVATAGLPAAVDLLIAQTRTARTVDAGRARLGRTGSPARRRPNRPARLAPHRPSTPLCRRSRIAAIEERACACSADPATAALLPRAPQHWSDGGEPACAG